MHKTEHYDIIIFENYHLATNHHFDRDLVGRLLKKGGMKVAIADIYGEEEKDEIDGMPVIHLDTPKRLPLPDDRFQKNPKNRIHSLLSHIRLAWTKRRYMRSVRKEIEDAADMFYCGSYHEIMSSTFMGLRKPCYYWGLRSARFTNFGSRTLRNPVVGFQSWLLRQRFLRNPWQRLLVSNKLIFDEHVALGIPPQRMIVRQERVVETTPQPNYDKLSPHFTLLVIGQLRKEKRIDITIDEFARFRKSNPDARLIIAGQSMLNYESVVQQAIARNPEGISRIDKRLDYDEYNNLIQQAHFVVLADARQQSSVTNGTMVEAIINYRPVITPNYQPYASFTGKNHLGIVYDPEKKGDLCRAINEAQEKTCKSFEPNITHYLNTISADKVAIEFTENLKKIKYVGI